VLNSFVNLFLAHRIVSCIVLFVMKKQYMFTFNYSYGF